MVTAEILTSSPANRVQSLSQPMDSTLTSTVAIVMTAPAEVDAIVIGGLSFTLERLDDEFLATDVQTGTYGEGDSQAEALAALMHSLRDLRDTLREHAGRLVPDLAADLEYLNRVL